MSRWRSVLQRIPPAERALLAVMAGTAVALGAFVALASEVFEGDTQRFDETVLRWFRTANDVSDPVGPLWFEEMVRDFTALGSFGLLVALTAFVVGFLVLLRKRGTAWMVALSLGGGIALSQSLKWGYARPRPDLVPHGMAVFTQSFPSGHAVLSAVVYLTLGTLLARTQPDPRVKVYLIAVAMLMTVVVGISRLYLGVHWPTDVLAGWAVGIAWSLLCSLVMLTLQRRGAVEG